MEQKNIEYKSSWHDDYLKWVCGFANAQGGRIYISIDDKGTVVGVDNSYELSEKIPNKIRNIMRITSEVNLLKDNVTEQTALRDIKFLVENIY
jgi:ATP-dependent DNA helicase RecG